jgi:hypothetical protein
MILFIVFCLPKELVLGPGIGQFSNANSFVLDQLEAETKTDLKYSSPIFISSSPIA